MNFGRPTQKRDDQSQADFEAELAIENTSWVPPKEMFSISPKAESDFHSQLKDKTAYSQLVCEGQKEGESDQDFISRLRSMTFTKEEYKSSAKKLFKYFPDDKPDDGKPPKQKDPPSAKPKEKQPPPSAKSSQSVPQNSKQAPDRSPRFGPKICSPRSD